MRRQYIFFKWDQQKFWSVILFPKNINFEICDKKSDSDGKLLILKTKIDENLCSL